MQVTVIRPAELGASEEKRWRELQASTPMGTHPCFSLTYARAVCRADENGRVAVVEYDGAIRAFLPHTTSGDRIATMLGGDQTALDGIISSDNPIDLRAVIRGAGLRGWRFGRAPEELRSLDPYRYQGSYHREQIHFVDLRDGYDGYVGTLPESVTKRISRTERYRRALQREVGEVSFEWNSSDPSLLPLLFKWKSDQFENMRTWLSSPSVRAYVQSLSEGDYADCSGVTSVLYAGSKPLAILFSLRCDHTLATWIVGYDPEYSRFSPGTILWLSVFREAAKRGVEMVDFGYWGLRYKQWFGNATYEVTSGGVWASRLETAARSLYRRAKHSHEAA
jgi:CelD/BcsL family acetyltransferase involved in cellulose biosynthesis